MPSRRAFTSSPDEAMAEPSAADLAAGILSPMEIPIRTPIPVLRIKRTEYLGKKQYNHIQRSIRKARRLDGIPEINANRYRQLQVYHRMRSSFELPTADWCTLSKSMQEMDEDFHVSKNCSKTCTCFSCIYLRRWSSTLQPYRCKASICDITFESFTDLFEHQLEVHGALDPRSNRVVSEVYHQQRGKLALPPATVYAGQQYMFPSRAPIPWKSMKELDAEAKVLHEKLRSYNRECYGTLWKLFNVGYQLVKRTGWSEMERQYEIAMEHFYSGMKFPATSRLPHDGCPSVERGRNWLTSTDRDDARFLCPIGVADKMEEEPEFVLIDTMRDAEKKATCIEINDDSDGEDASSKGRTDSETKIFKTDDDVEMKGPEEEDDKPATVDEGDSDNDDCLPIKSESEHAFTTAARQEFDTYSDSDETVMSEAKGDNNIAELRKPEDNNADESDADSDNDDNVRDSGSARKADISDTDGSSDSEDEQDGNDEASINIDSDSETEEELEPSKGDNEAAGSGSDSDSSEDEVELKPAKNGDNDTVSDSSSSDDDVELNSSKDDSDSETSGEEEEAEELTPSKGGSNSDSDSDSSEDEVELKPSTGAIDQTISDSDSDSVLMRTTVPPRPSL
ncbi:hypothetical protein V7S43_001450 [Phytophthora oleae]|uniref:C2H2-type domain-containing protein n=1 Tax=Phytophthora oleae TaxID=2107226 RepID=A0ABD3G3R1_9STRA